MSLWYLTENLFSAGTAWTKWRAPSPLHTRGWLQVEVSLQVCLFSFSLCTQGWPEAWRCSSHTAVMRDVRITAHELRMAKARRERASMGPWHSLWATALALGCYIWMFCYETQMKFYLFKLSLVRPCVICTGNILTKPMLCLGWERATVEIIHLHHRKLKIRCVWTYSTQQWDESSRSTSWAPKSFLRKTHPAESRC